MKEKDVVAMCRRSLIGFLVVALFTASVTGAASAQAAEGGPDLGDGWTPRIQTEEETFAATVAGTPELGYVAFFDGNVGWFSADGVEWQRISFPVGAGDFHVNDLAAGDSGLVAVLASPRTGPPQSLAFSPDGQSWTVIDEDNLPEVTGAGGLIEVEAGPNGFVVTGNAQPLDATEGDATPTSTFAWFSPDGRNWSRANLPEECCFARVVAHGDGWVAVLDRAGTPTFSSDNGIDWSERNANTVLDGLGPTISYSGRLAMVNSNPFRISVSDDGGSSWESRPINVSGSLLEGLTANDLGIVGSYFDETETGLVPGGLLFSPDGATWVTYPADIILIDLAAAADSIIAVGPAGIYTWTPPGSELLPGAPEPEVLADTGTDSLTLIGIAALLLSIGTAALIARRRMHAGNAAEITTTSGP